MHGPMLRRVCSKASLITDPLQWLAWSRLSHRRFAACRTWAACSARKRLHCNPGHTLQSRRTQSRQHRHIVAAPLGVCSGRSPPRATGQALSHQLLAPSATRPKTLDSSSTIRHSSLRLEFHSWPWGRASLSDPPACPSPRG